MIAEILNSHRIVLHDLNKLIADESDELFFARPVPEMNPPAWIVRHLVYSCQMIGGEIGLRPVPHPSERVPGPKLGSHVRHFLMHRRPAGSGSHTRG